MRLPKFLVPAFTFHWAEWRPIEATRCTVGVALPLLLATWTGHRGLGILAALGALYAGVASYGGTLRARLRLMSQTTLLMALVTLLGTLVGGSLIASVLVVGVVAVCLALYSVSGRAANTLAIQGTGVLIVFSGLQMPAGQALGNAFIVFCGGMIQVVLLAATTPFNPLFPEREGVARIYESLSRFVANICNLKESIPGSAPFQEAWAMFDEPVPPNGRDEHARLLKALRTAEGIRAGLVGLTRAYQRIPASEATDEVLHQFRPLANALGLVAAQVRHGEPIDVELGTFEPPSPAWEDLANWQRLLSDALKSLGDPPAPVELPEAPGSIFERMWTAITKLPSSGSLERITFLYSIRYALIATLGVALYRLVGLNHGYWMPLTICFVLRPDFASTLTRGVARLLGTYGGILIASWITDIVHPSVAVLTWLVLAATWLSFTVFLANYALYTACLTLFIVFSIASSGLSEHAVGSERLIATSAGVVMAIAATLIWPVWQSGQIRRVLMEALEAQRRYGEQVKAFVQGQPFEDIETARQSARQLRVQAETLFASAELEPQWGRLALPAMVRDVLVGLDSNAARMLAIHARMTSPEHLVKSRDLPSIAQESLDEVDRLESLLTA